MKDFLVGLFCIFAFLFMTSMPVIMLVLYYCDIR